MQRSRKLAIAGVGAALAAGIGVVAVAVAGAGDELVSVVLRDAEGIERGTVEFSNGDGGTDVEVLVTSTPEGIKLDAFHGFHIHANSDPANGEGCVADPAEPTSKWFVAVDGHWKEEGEIHGGHHGDLPSLFLTGGGAARATFTTDRIDLGDLSGKAVILHAGPDNFANIPMGTEPNQYTANSSDAVTATHNTGNAGDRLLCGLID
jgi:Cu-Zn family superoxide dismutase